MPTRLTLFRKSAYKNVTKQERWSAKKYSNYSESDEVIIMVAHYAVTINYNLNHRAPEYIHLILYTHRAQGSDSDSDGDRECWRSITPVLEKRAIRSEQASDWCYKLKT
jgi:hypothetical protein